MDLYGLTEWESIVISNRILNNMVQSLHTQSEDVGGDGVPLANAPSWVESISSISVPKYLKGGSGNTSHYCSHHPNLNSKVI